MNIVYNTIGCIFATDCIYVNSRPWKGRVRCSNVIFTMKTVSSHEQSRTLRNAINKWAGLSFNIINIVGTRYIDRCLWHNVRRCKQPRSSETSQK